MSEFLQVLPIRIPHLRLRGPGNQASAGAFKPGPNPRKQRRPPHPPRPPPDLRELAAEVKDEGVGLWISSVPPRRHHSYFLCPALDCSPRAWKFDLEVLVVLKPRSLLVLPVFVHLLESRLAGPAGVPPGFSLPFDGRRYRVWQKRPKVWEQALLPKTKHEPSCTHFVITKRSFHAAHSCGGPLFLTNPQATCRLGGPFYQVVESGPGGLGTRLGPVCRHHPQRH